MKNSKIYCAGPLFNEKEKEEMFDISQVLEKYGFTTFLPQRDGIEFTDLSKYLHRYHPNSKEINLLLSKAVFFLDVYHVSTSQAIVVNLNGRVPDEGAMVEAGIAWSFDIPVIIYKNDSRSTFNGTDNPMILGLSNFEIVTSIDEIPPTAHQLTNEYEKGYPESLNCKKTLDYGEQIWLILEKYKKDKDKVACELLNIFDELSGGSNESRREIIISSRSDL